MWRNALVLFHNYCVCYGIASISTMSDLAPFVAAALRDLLQELMDENNQLRQEKRNRSMIRITGRNGTPVYYENSVTNGRGSLNRRGGDGLWVVDLPTRKDASGNSFGLPWKIFQKLEISLGGVVLRETSNNLEHFSMNDDMLHLYFDYGHAFQVVGQLTSTVPEDSRETNGSVDSSYLERIVDSVDVRIHIHKVLFRKSYISDLLV